MQDGLRGINESKWEYVLHVNNAAPSCWCVACCYSRGPGILLGSLALLTFTTMILGSALAFYRLCLHLYCRKRRQWLLLASSCSFSF